MAKSLILIAFTAVPLLKSKSNLFEQKTTMATSHFPSTLDTVPEVESSIRATVVIPAFNEVDSAAKLCEALVDLEASLPAYDFQFVVVDDGSTDQTVEVLRELFRHRENAVVIEHQTNRGVAAAIMTGVHYASTEIVCSMDFDCSYEPTQFAELLPLMTDQVDLITGSPYHPDGDVLNVPKWRLVFSRCASIAYRVVTGLNLYTYTSCFRVYRRSSMLNMKLRNEGFVGVAELLWRMHRRGANIIECPAVLSIREFGQSKMRVVGVTLQHLKLLSRAFLFRVFRRGLPENEYAHPRYPVPHRPQRMAESKTG